MTTFRWQSIFWLSVIACNFKQVQCKKYINSLENRIELLKLDNQLLDHLKEYEQRLLLKINVLRRVSKEWIDPLNKAKGQEEDYLSNPLHSFPFMRQMVEDWEGLEKYIQKPVGQDLIHNIETMRLDLPQLGDLNEYFLKLKDRKLELNQYRQLSSLDYYSVGMFYLKENQMQNATEWLQMAKWSLANYPKEYDKVLGVTDTLVSRFLIYSLVSRNKIN